MDKLSALLEQAGRLEEAQSIKVKGSDTPDDIFSAALRGMLQGLLDEIPKNLKDKRVSWGAAGYSMAKVVIDGVPTKKGERTDVEQTTWITLQFEQHGYITVLVSVERSNMFGLNREEWKINNGDKLGPSFKRIAKLISEV